MTPRGNGEASFGILMHRQLKLVHQMLRSDLTVCRELAVKVAAGAPAADIAEQIAALQTRSPIWTLQVNCLYHCRVVHAHHGLEDADMFPALRRSNPELSAVVDKLMADHRSISGLLDDVEESARQLDDAAANARGQTASLRSATQSPGGSPCSVAVSAQTARRSRPSGSGR
jgi:hypothetical protein